MNGEDIQTARKTILERNPSAFDDKFRAPTGGDVGISSASPWMHQPPSYHGPPAANRYDAPHPFSPRQQYQNYHAGPPASPPQYAGYLDMGGDEHRMASSPPTLPPASSSRLMNKFGCKCRRSSCLKKVS